MITIKICRVAAVESRTKLARTKQRSRVYIIDIGGVRRFFF